MLLLLVDRAETCKASRATWTTHLAVDAHKALAVGAQEFRSVERRPRGRLFAAQLQDLGVRAGTYVSVRACACVGMSVCACACVCLHMCVHAGICMLVRVCAS
jgi:hypothetical protein